MIDSGPADLMQQVQDFFQKAYAGADSAPNALADDGLVLAFEPLGMPVSSADFRVNPDDDSSPLSPVLGIQRTSEYSNWIPRIDGTVLQVTDRTLEDQYASILEGAQPANDASVVALGAIKGPATELFQNTSIGEIGTGVLQYHPVQATPQDWYDATDASNWVTQSFSAGAPPPAGSTLGRPLIWHVLPTALTPLLAAHTATEPVAETHPIDSAVFRERYVRSPMEYRTAAASAEPAVTRQMTPNSTAWKPLVAISQQAATQAVQSNSLAIAFDFCLVRLNRAWLSHGFLSNRSWFLPGYKAAELSTGSDLTGEGDFSLVPIAFIAIKELKITANWSANDIQAAQNAVSIGSFSLVGRSIDATTNTVTCPGIQIIAWVCEAQPLLPPMSDPTLAATAPPATVTTTAATTPATVTTTASTTPATVTTSASNTPMTVTTSTSPMPATVVTTSSATPAT